MNKVAVKRPRGDRRDLVQLEKVVICAEGGALFQGLTRMIESHLVSSKVELFDTLPDCDDADPQVRLVLLHDVLGDKLGDCVSSCRVAYPNAAIAMLVARSEDPHPLRNWLVDEGLIQGVLPLNLKLEVWLAAVSLLMSGGEFFPTTRRSATPVPIPQIRPPVEDRFADRPVRPATASHALDGLTRREREILSLVAQGYQNKVIADRVSLSEHTVKVHVHNLMTKLHVNNRTQAAAAFHASFEPMSAAR